MITALKYEITFPNGRALAANLQFSKGTTAITGPNESGKSFCLEMIRFNLFGSAALRGLMDDYKSLKTSMEFTIRGATYRTERTSSNAKLFRADEVIATGTKPVNTKVLSILGYGLNVFDVAHAANQDEVLALGAMLPTERKRMVDQVIGLDRMDAIEKWIGEEVTGLNREIAVLSKALVEPAEPKKPEDYEPSEVLSLIVDEKRKEKSHLDYLLGWLSTGKQEPSVPVRPTTQGQLVDLNKELAQIDTVEADRRHILSLPIIDPTLSAEWERYDKWAACEAFQKAHPKPELTFDEVEVCKASHDRWRRTEELKRKLVSLQSDPSATCPSCKATFSLSHDHIKEVEDELSGIEPGTQYDQRYLAEQERRIMDWLDTATRETAQVHAFTHEVQKPPKARPRFSDGITEAERAERLAALPQGLRPRATVAAEIDAINRWAAACEAYEHSLDGYQAWKQERDEKAGEAAGLAKVADELPYYQNRLQAALSYESAMTAYEVSKAAYEAALAAVEAKKVELGGWKEAKEAMVDIRAEIKTHLVPSLSKVASHLLAQMTGGQRSSIIVNEDFDITVDGQRLETLSGSGKACANLALRIGLGQVLTNNVLSLFIGDEIDASMDQDRANNTQDSLKSLASVISQIVLVTHKIPSADTVVRLG